MLTETSLPFQNQLEPGERLLWSGRPRQGLMLRRTDVFMIPFSLLWGGFAIFWFAMAVGGGAPAFMALWGLPFVFVGLYLIGGRFFWDAYQRSKTFYAVTDRRVLILSSGVMGQNLRALNPKSLPETSLNLRPDGSGTITFGTSPFFYGMGNTGFGRSQRYAPPAFEGIADARSVYTLIQRVQRGEV